MRLYSYLQNRINSKTITDDKEKDYQQCNEIIKNEGGNSEDFPLRSDVQERTISNYVQ